MPESDSPPASAPLAGSGTAPSLNVEQLVRLLNACSVAYVLSDKWDGSESAAQLRLLAERLPSLAAPSITATEEAPPYLTRNCRGHWHVTHCGEDMLIPGDPFATQEEAQASADRLNAGENISGAAPAGAGPSEEAQQLIANYGMRMATGSSEDNWQAHAALFAFIASLESRLAASEASAARLREERDELVEDVLLLAASLRAPSVERERDGERLDWLERRKLEVIYVSPMLNHRAEGWVVATEDAPVLPTLREAIDAARARQAAPAPGGTP